MKRHIEDCLRARGVRYFRGHQDDEFFFLMDFVAGAQRGRLNVHLGVDDDAVVVSISPDRYFPAENLDSLNRVVHRWNAGRQVVDAVVHGSCDPQLVSVAALGRHGSTDVATLTEFLDEALEAAVELFEEVASATAPAGAVLRDAG